MNCKLWIMNYALCIMHYELWIIMAIIIAEAGVNHNGDLDRALIMVEAAKDAGADYIKFQTFKSDLLVTPEGKTAQYQKANCDADSQIEMLRALELSYEDFRTIAL